MHDATLDDSIGTAVLFYNYALFCTGDLAMRDGQDKNPCL
jgi:hypothetical protein